MRFERLSLFAVTLGIVALLLACGKKPKYPACGKDKDCKEAEHCINKQCLQCGEDSHCDDGEKCVEGGCVSKTVKKKDTSEEDGLTPCVSNNDCEDDEDCVDKKCKRPWQSNAPAGVECSLQTVYFDYDQASIPQEARDQLGATAECIKQAPEDRGVYIVGHTDPRGTEEYNIALSERRARAAADYLARLGIDPARFRVIPKGEAEASGTGDSSFQQDRRVEFEWR